MLRLKLQLDNAVRRVEALIDIFMGKPFPGTPQLLSHDHPAVLDRLQDQSSDDSSQKSFLESLKDGYLWGVPKKRKSFEKRKMKQFGSSYRLPYKPRTDLITCLHCGNSHEAHTICGTCYMKVKEETREIQKAMDIRARVPDHQEVVVLYDGETTGPSTAEGKKVVEMQKKRPSWFHDILITKVTPDNTPTTVGWEARDIQDKYRHKFPTKRNF